MLDQAPPLEDHSLLDQELDEVPVELPVDELPVDVPVELPVEVAVRGVPVEEVPVVSVRVPVALPCPCC